MKVNVLETDKSQTDMPGNRVLYSYMILLPANGQYESKHTWNWLVTYSKPPVTDQ